MFSTRNYKFTVTSRYTLQLVPKKGEVNRMTVQIEVKLNKKFDNVNRNNLNRSVEGLL